MTRFTLRLYCSQYVNTTEAQEYARLTRQESKTTTRKVLNKA